MKIITIEEHYVSARVNEQLFALQEKEGAKNDLPIGANKSKLDLAFRAEIEDVAAGRIKFMDENGISMQIVSYDSNGPQGLSPELAIPLCQQANDDLAAAVRINPTRFAGFATLPMADPQAAAIELERAVHQGLVGAMLTGTLNGQFFEDSFFFPVFAKAAELDVPIYMHPSVIAASVSDYYYTSNEWNKLIAMVFAGAGYGWHIDAGIHVVRMILSGIFDKLPNLKLISGHWGEFVPYYLERLDAIFDLTPITLKRKVSEYYKENVYITPSGMFTVPQLQLAIAEVGADHILYSCDYPHNKATDARSFLQSAPISNEDKEKIAYRNAEKLFKVKSS